jgi:hypothetical protein
VTFDLESDPVESGWLQSYAHPGGNITVVFSDFPEFSSKWLELLQEAVPGLASLVVLWDPTGISKVSFAGRAKRYKNGSNRRFTVDIKQPQSYAVERRAGRRIHDHDDFSGRC